MDKLNKCDNCLNSRRIISENGLHSVCCLPDKQAVECLIGRKDQKIMLPTTEDKEVKE